MKARGLCWPCYYRPGVREQYPITSKFGRHGIGTANKSTQSASPTSTIPGTAEHIEVLAARAGRNESLFHPDDSIEPTEGAE